MKRNDDQGHRWLAALLLTLLLGSNVAVGRWAGSLVDEAQDQPPGHDALFEALLGPMPLLTGADRVRLQGQAAAVQERLRLHLDDPFEILRRVIGDAALEDSLLEAAASTQPSTADLLSHLAGALGFATPRDELLSAGERLDALPTGLRDAIRLLILASLDAVRAQLLVLQRLGPEDQALLAHHLSQGTTDGRVAEILSAIDREPLAKAAATLVAATHAVLPVLQTWRFVLASTDPVPRELEALGRARAMLGSLAATNGPPPSPRIDALDLQRLVESDPAAMFQAAALAPSLADALASVADTVLRPAPEDDGLARAQTALAALEGAIGTFDAWANERALRSAPARAIDGPVPVQIEFWSSLGRQADRTWTPASLVTFASDAAGLDLTPVPTEPAASLDEAFETLYASKGHTLTPEERRLINQGKDALHPRVVASLLDLLPAMVAADQARADLASQLSTAEWQFLRAAAPHVASMTEAGIQSADELRYVLAFYDVRSRIDASAFFGAALSLAQALERTRSSLGPLVPPEPSEAASGRSWWNSFLAFVEPVFGPSAQAQNAATLCTTTAALGQPGNDICFRDPLGLVVVSGTRTTRYDDTVNPALSLDLGGPDQYLNGAPISSGSASLLIDMGGHDDYDARESDAECVLACVTDFGLALLYDHQGDDTYRSQALHGQGVLLEAGFAILFDNGGRNEHEHEGDGIGFTATAPFGLAAVVDGSGPDSLRLDGSGLGATASSLPQTLALYVNQAGDDIYQATGSAFGVSTAETPNGLALFLDLDGRDGYTPSAATGLGVHEATRGLFEATWFSRRQDDSVWQEHTFTHSRGADLRRAAPDTDRDNVPDLVENMLGSDPRSAASRPSLRYADQDRDIFPDLIELPFGSDPTRNEDHPVSAPDAPPGVSYPTAPATDAPLLGRLGPYTVPAGDDKLLDMRGAIAVDDAVLVDRPIAVGDVGPTVFDADYRVAISLGGDDIWRNNAGADAEFSNHALPGLAVDLSGDDTYDAPARSNVQGAATYLEGFGLLVDLDGHDTYVAAAHAQGSFNEAQTTTGTTDVDQRGRQVGLLLDAAGDDSYSLMSGPGQGFASRFGGHGVLFDLDGNDSYHATRQASVDSRGTQDNPGAVPGHPDHAPTPVVGVLLDRRGDDRYSYLTPPASAGTRGFRNGLLGLAYFADLGGDDAYTCRDPCTDPVSAVPVDQSAERRNRTRTALNEFGHSLAIDGEYAHNVDDELPAALAVSLAGTWDREHDPANPNLDDDSGFVVDVPGAAGTTIALLALGSTAPTAYRDPYVLSIDLGGADAYEGGAGATNILGPSAHRMSPLIPLNPPAQLPGGTWPAAPAFATLLTVPAAIAIDLGDDDDDYHDTRGVAQGSGVLGTGILVDEAGDDSYDSPGRAQGFGMAGHGVLLDLAGDDRYVASSLAMAASAAGGVGVHIDAAGDDERILEQDGLAAVVPAAPAFETSPTQLPGVPSTAVFVDLDGDDVYRAAHQSIASANAAGSALFVDRTGDDNYATRSRVLAFATTGGSAFFVDAEGSDRYRSEADALGAIVSPRTGSPANAFAWDITGTDAYIAQRRALGYARGTTLSTQSPAAGSATFLDTQGLDLYTYLDPVTALPISLPTATPSNGREWAQSDSPLVPGTGLDEEGTETFVPDICNFAGACPSLTVEWEDEPRIFRFDATRDLNEATRLLVRVQSPNPSVDVHPLVDRVSAFRTAATGSVLEASATRPEADGLYRLRIDPSAWPRQQVQGLLVVLELRSPAGGTDFVADQTFGLAAASSPPRVSAVSGDQWMVLGDAHPDVGRHVAFGVSRHFSDVYAVRLGDKIFDTGIPRTEGWKRLDFTTIADGTRVHLENAATGEDWTYDVDLGEQPFQPVNLHLINDGVVTGGGFEFDSATLYGAAGDVAFRSRFHGPRDLERNWAPNETGPAAAKVLQFSGRSFEQDLSLRYALVGSEGHLRLTSRACPLPHVRPQGLSTFAFDDRDADAVADEDEPTMLFARPAANLRAAPQAAGGCLWFDDADHDGTLDPTEESATVPDRGTRGFTKAVFVFADTPLVVQQLRGSGESVDADSFSARPAVLPANGKGFERQPKVRFGVSTPDQASPRLQVTPQGSAPFAPAAIPVPTTGPAGFTHLQWEWNGRNPLGAPLEGESAKIQIAGNDAPTTPLVEATLPLDQTPPSTLLGLAPAVGAPNADFTVQLDDDGAVTHVYVLACVASTGPAECKDQDAWNTTFLPNPQVRPIRQGECPVYNDANENGAMEATELLAFVACPNLQIRTFAATGSAPGIGTPATLRIQSDILDDRNRNGIVDPGERIGSVVFAAQGLAVGASFVPARPRLQLTPHGHCLVYDDRNTNSRLDVPPLVAASEFVGTVTCPALETAALHGGAYVVFDDRDADGAVDADEIVTTVAAGSRPPNLRMGDRGSTYCLVTDAAEPQQAFRPASPLGILGAGTSQKCPNLRALITACSVQTTTPTVVCTFTTFDDADMNGIAASGETFGGTFFGPGSVSHAARHPSPALWPTSDPENCFAFDDQNDPTAGTPNGIFESFEVRIGTLTRPCPNLKLRTEAGGAPPFTVYDDRDGDDAPDPGETVATRGATPRLFFLPAASGSLVGTLPATGVSDGEYLVVATLAVDEAGNLEGALGTETVDGVFRRVLAGWDPAGTPPPNLRVTRLDASLPSFDPCTGTVGGLQIVLNGNRISCAPSLGFVHLRADDDVSFVVNVSAKPFNPLDAVDLVLVPSETGAAPVSHPMAPCPAQGPDAFCFTWTGRSSTQEGIFLPTARARTMTGEALLPAAQRLVLDLTPPQLTILPFTYLLGGTAAARDDEVALRIRLTELLGSDQSTLSGPVTIDMQTVSSAGLVNLVYDSSARLFRTRVRFDRNDVANGCYDLSVVATDLSGNRQDAVSVEVCVLMSPSPAGGIQILNLGPTQATLRWSSTEEVEAIVRFGLDPANLDRNVPALRADAATPTYVALLQALQPNSTYTAVVRTVNQNGIEHVSAPLAFETPLGLMLEPVPTQPLALRGVTTLSFDATSAVADQVDYTVIVERGDPASLTTIATVRESHPADVTRRIGIPIDTRLVPDGDELRLRILMRRAHERLAVSIDDVRIDNTPPRLLEQRPEPGITTSNHSLPIGFRLHDALSGIDGPNVSIRRDGVPLTVMREGDVFVATPGPVNASGVVKVEVEANDTLGNRLLEAWTYSVDSEAPDVEFDAPGAFSAVGTSGLNDLRPGGEVTVELRARDASGIDEVQFRSVTMGLAWTHLVRVPGSSNLFRATTTISDDVPEGVHHLEARIVDTVGNVRVGRFGQAVVDATPPKLLDVHATHFAPGTEAIHILADEPVSVQVEALGGHATSRSAFLSTQAQLLLVNLPGPGDAEILVEDAAGNRARRILRLEPLPTIQAGLEIRQIRIQDIQSDRVELAWAATDPQIVAVQVLRSTADQPMVPYKRATGGVFRDAAVDEGRTYVYAFAAVDGNGIIGPVSGLVAVQVPAEPHLELGAFDRAVGTESVPFRFQVTYRHAVGLVPDSVLLRIGAEAHDVGLLDEASACIESCRYGADVFLAPTRLGDEPARFHVEARIAGRLVHYPEQGDLPAPLVRGDAASAQGAEAAASGLLAALAAMVGLSILRRRRTT